jgi:hypothetical protein
VALAHLEIDTDQEQEWQELQAVLQSGILDKSQNLKSFLEYVAQQYFSGNNESAKEYSIAVQALHRMQEFDPQSDNIVRVTAHSLRKKLEHFYATEGAHHAIEVKLPPGKYALKFERKEQAALPASHREEVSAPPEQPVQAGPTAVQPVPSADQNVPSARPRPKMTLILLAGIGATGLLLLASYYLHWSAQSARSDNALPAAKSGTRPALPEAVPVATDKVVRIRFGPASQPYTDTAGQTWLADRFCTGGSTFSHPNHEIRGTDDPALFQEGREGKSRCRIPVPPGSYQLLFLFADTAGDKVAARQVDLRINDALTAALDVVDEAGGDDIGLGKAVTGIHPMQDGTVHLDFTSDGAFLNAVEITPSASDRGTTVRMLAGPVIFHDHDGNTWMPERFFQGGRRTFHPDSLQKIENSKLFEWARYGHFHYRIPVVAGQDYKLRLYFAERWFGTANGGPGGPGSRVFDVYCNGKTLLKDFDILQSQNGGAAVMAFDHVKPTAQGALELDFIPVKNYPLIDAIEIEPD